MKITACLLILLVPAMFLHAENELAVYGNIGFGHYTGTIKAKAGYSGANEGDDVWDAVMGGAERTHGITYGGGLAYTHAFTDRHAVQAGLDFSVTTTRILHRDNTGTDYPPVPSGVPEDIEPLGFHRINAPKIALPVYYKLRVPFRSTTISFTAGPVLALNFGGSGQYQETKLKSFNPFDLGIGMGISCTLPVDAGGAVLFGFDYKHYFLPPGFGVPSMSREDFNSLDTVNTSNADPVTFQIGYVFSL